MSWRMVDEGWGRRSADFATLLEPTAVREYVSVYRRIGLEAGDRVLDMACGSGLALELAAVWGARVSGIDASDRLVAVARRRNPEGDIRVGDMADSGFPAASFDVVTSFRGIWATTPGAVREARRVLRPGGRVALTFWGNVSKAAGAPLFHPLRLTSEAQLAHQADMNALGHPGVAARFLAEAGLVPGELFAVPFAFEFADPEHYARALAATGPGYEAIQVAGEERFREACLEVGETFARDGLPLRVGLPLLGIIGRAPGGDEAP